jgi:hypothetical protein
MNIRILLALVALLMAGAQAPAREPGPAERGTAFLGELRKGGLRHREGWFSLILGGKKAGTVKETVSIVPDSAGKKTIALLRQTLLQGATGTAVIREECRTDAALRLLERKWRWKGEIQGWGSIDKEVVYAVSWEGERARVTRREGAAGSRTWEVLCPGGGFGDPGLLAHLLPRAGSGKLAFGVLRLRGGPRHTRVLVDVSDPAPRSLPQGKVLAQEIRWEGRSVLLGRDGKILRAGEAAEILERCASEEKARTGLRAYVPGRDASFRDLATPEKLTRALFHAILRRDRPLAERCFRWKALARNFEKLKGLGEVEEEEKERMAGELLKELKPAVLGDVMAGRPPDPDPVFLLRLEFLTRVSPLPGGGVEIRIPPGKGRTFLAEKAKGEWKITGFRED